MKITDLRAKDIMKTDVIKAYGSMTLTEVAALFDAQHITGAPVVEGSEKLIGVVSETDFVRERATRKDEVHPYFKDSGNGVSETEADDESPFDESLPHGEEKTVEDIMTPWTISVGEEAPITEVASIMVKHHIHRVLVTDKQFRLKGIITTMDLARVISRSNSYSSKAA